MTRKTRKNAPIFVWLRKLRALVMTALAVVVILTAVAVGIGRMLTPYAEHARPWLEEMLSERLQLPVSIGSVEAQWPRLTPQITLQSVRVGQTDALLASIDQARVELHFPNLIQQDRNLISLVVLGLDLVLAEDEEGQWGIRLEGGGQFVADQRRERPVAGDLMIRDASVSVVPANLPETRWQLSEADIRRSAEQTVLLAHLHPAFAEDSALELRMQAEHPNGGIESVRSWAGLESLALDRLPVTAVQPDPAALEGVALDAQMWLDWSKTGESRLDGTFRLTGHERDEAQGQVTIERRGRQIEGRLIELTLGDDPVISNLGLTHSGRRWALAVDSMNLSGVHALGSQWLAGMPGWPDHLAGTIADVGLVYESRKGLDAFNGRIRGLAISPVARAPGVSNLDLDLALAGDRAVISPSGTPTVEWPRMLRQSVDLDRIGGRVLVSSEAVELDALAIEHEVVDAQADGWIYLGRQRPFLDFGVTVDRIETDDLSPWLPYGIIPDAGLAWLDRSVNRIGSARGGLRYHMRAGRKAADFEPGDFHGWIDFADAELDYAEGWPLARALQGRVDFVGRSLLGRVDQGRMGEVALAADPVVIPDLTNEPELSFLVAADGVEAGELADVMAQMPVAAWTDILELMRWSGPVSLTSEIILPFARMEDWALDGEISLEGVDFALPAIDVGLQSMEGTAFFDRRSLLPGVLHANANQQPVMLDLAADFESPAQLQLGAALNPVELVSAESRLRPLIKRFSGSSYWQLELSAAEPEGIRLGLYSDLEGLAMELPAPLAKAQNQRWPLTVDAVLTADQREISVNVADRAELGLIHGLDGWRLGLGLGDSGFRLPSAPGFDLRGSLEALDLLAWQELADTMVDGVPIDHFGGRVVLQLDRLYYGDLYTENVELAADREDNAWELLFEGQGAAGRITLPVPMDSGRVLAVDLERLDINDTRPEPLQADLESRPGPDQTSTANPAGLPPLHMLIEDFSYESLQLGRVRVETHAVRDGMEFERIDINGPALRLQGRGRWVDAGQGPYSEFEGRLITASLSELLAGLGYEAEMDAARTQVDIGGRWPGAPHDFSLRRLEGDMDIRISDGTIPEARPGAGRLLGLASVSTIPRRLTLDFRDVFAQGLKFDRIEGTFSMDGGVARTDGLKIDSPAAQITVTGSTDMVARQYDQRLLVEPGVGATLPVIGVLAGGPVGALAGLVLQQLFDQPLRGITEAHYSVTGNWDSPVVELIEARVADEGGEEEIVLPDSAPPD